MELLAKFALLSIVLIAVLGCSVLSSANNGQVSYGRWQSYIASEPLTYPDFTIRCTRNGTPDMDIGIPLGPVFEFVVSDGTSEATVAWSSGTGNIGPTLFEIGAKKFFLEMQVSEHLRERAESDQQIVIWPESEFLRRKRSWWRW